MPKYNFDPYSFMQYKEYEYTTIETIIDSSHSFDEVCEHLRRNGTPFNSLAPSTQKYILNQFHDEIQAMLEEKD